MRISELAGAIGMLVTSALFAQTVDSPVEFQDRSGLPDVRKIVGSSIVATQLR